MKNAVHTETIEKKYATYTVEVTTWYDDRCGDLYQTHINGKSLLNQDKSIEEALLCVPARIRSFEEIAQMKAESGNKTCFWEA